MIVQRDFSTPFAVVNVGRNDEGINVDNNMQSITPCLWFDTQAEEAAKFYVSVFTEAKRPNTKLLQQEDYNEASAEASGQPKDSTMTVMFMLDGQVFMALNGGPLFKFTEAVSFMVNCKDQAEVDFFWNKLSAGGAESQCGWLKDTFGLSWQIVPEAFPALMEQHPDKAEQIMGALMQMKKIDIKKLEQAAGV